MKQKLILAALLAVSLAACTNGNEPATPEDDPVAAQVNAAISGINTRTSGTSWTTDDCIGISTASNGYTQYENIPYKYNGTKFSPTEGAIYFQDAQEEVTFNAYYPFDGTPYSMPATIEAATTADFQTAEKQPRIDFLFAKGATASKAEPAVNFTGENAFHHCMSQITLTFIEGANMSFTAGSLTGYTLKGLKLSGTFNLEDGTAQPTATAAAEKLSIATSDVVATEMRYTAPPVILFPQDMNGTIGIEVTVNGQTYHATLVIPNGEKALKAGNNYTWPVTVSKTGVSVGQAEIKDWTPVTGSDATATM